MNTRTLAALLYLLPALCVDAQTLRPERVVAGHTVVSKRDPALQIRLPRTVKYVGADAWLLYDVADCELHVFVEADAQKVVKRLYWVQFEQYVPTRPELHYDYENDPIHRSGSRSLHVKVRFGATDDQVKAGSDSEHVRGLIRAAGYTMPPGMINVRLIYLPDTEHRREVMVIYGEDSALSGVAWNDLLPPDGRAVTRWPGLRQSITDRALRKIQFSGAE